MSGQQVGERGGKQKVSTDLCPKCSQSATSPQSDKGGNIRCKICTFWWHPACGGLGTEESELFLRLSRLGSTDLWQCQTCQVGMGDMALRWEKTGNIVAGNSARIEKLEAKVGKEEARADELEKTLKKTKNELEELKNNMAEMKKDATKTILTEVTERENNHKNVIIHNVPESYSSNPSEQQAHDIQKLQIILGELGLMRFINADIREHIKFIRRIGERNRQEVRPIKVGFIFSNMKERLMESARYLNKIPSLRSVSITLDQTEIQRKEETSLWRDAANQNLSPTTEMKKKGLVVKVVGPRGQRRSVMVPLKRTEEVDKEGRVRLRVVSRRREGAGGRGQEQARRETNGALSAPVSGGNLEPLGKKKQGNGQGAVGGRSRREEQEVTSGAKELKQLRQGLQDRVTTERRFQSFDSGEVEEEEGRRKETGKKEVTLLRSSTLLLPGVPALVSDLGSARSGLL